MRAISPVRTTTIGAYPMPPVLADTPPRSCRSSRPPPPAPSPHAAAPRSNARAGRRRRRGRGPARRRRCSDLHGVRSGSDRGRPHGRAGAAMRRRRLTPIALMAGVRRSASGSRMTARARTQSASPSTGARSTASARPNGSSNHRSASRHGSRPERRFDRVGRGGGVKVAGAPAGRTTATPPKVATASARRSSSTAARSIRGRLPRSIPAMTRPPTRAARPLEWPTACPRTTP